MPTSMTDAAAARWERKRRKGLLLHTLFWFVAWGAFGVAIHAVIRLAMGDVSVAVRLAPRHFLAQGVFGVWLGVFSWKTRELGYARWLASRGSAEASTIGASSAISRSIVPGVMLIGLCVWAASTFLVYRLDERVDQALEAGRIEDARADAPLLLALAWLHPLDWAHGNAIQHGHTALGLSALNAGDIESAKAHLLAAGRTPGSPQLDSFGPDMVLAKALLEHGERETVLTYFDQCRAFWQLDRGRLDNWAATVRSGGIPDFGALVVRGPP